jgi:hypothetical protein
LGHPPIQASPAKSLTTPHYREETMKFKDDYRIDRLIELMRQESVLINEEILIIGRSLNCTASAFRNI